MNIEGSGYALTLNGCAVLTWPNMPAALTAVPGSLAKVNLSQVSLARLSTHVVVAGFAGASILAQASLDGVVWVDGPEVVISPSGLRESSVIAIPPAWCVDVFMRLAGRGGNGAVDPQFGLTILQLA